MAAAAVLALGLAACGGAKPGDEPPPAPGGLTVTSADFEDQGPIPVDDSCDGAGRRPPLRWTGVPGAARELAVVVTDPDAGGFVHWTVYGLAPSVRGLDRSGLPRGARQGTTTNGKVGWTPPCPPQTEQHRYLVDVYWLRRPRGLKPGAAASDVTAAIRAGAGGRGELVGRYRRAG
jgi:Raf kinase inhibitor-like YbhB/YbcL family protein